MEMMLNVNRPKKATTKIGNKEIVRGLPITTPRKVQQNRPDLIVKKTKEKSCFIIEISVPLDQNIKAKEKEEIHAYMPQ